MNFFLLEMTYLRYFIPLTIAGNKKGIKSRYFVHPSHKYNCPKKHYDILAKLSNKYNFEIYSSAELSSFPGTTFMIEDMGYGFLSDNHKKISIPFMTDFINSNNAVKYINNIDTLILSSKYISDYYKNYPHSKNFYKNVPESEKIVYLGSPKFDYLEHDRKKILTKYKLDDKKYALVIFPKTRDIGKINLSKVYDYLHNMGYQILVKTRGKDPENDKKHRGDCYYEDFCWYPHDTMELINVSDIVINFGSTAVEECVMLNTPLIDFNIKPKEIVRGYDFLYNHDYCKVFSSVPEYEEFFNSVDKVIKAPSTSYERVIEECLFAGNSSEKILNYLF